MIPAGQRRHLVTLAEEVDAAPGSPEQDDGGYETTFEPLTPESVYAHIVPATARELERLMAGTAIAMATHLVYLPFHPDVTTKTVITFGTRTFRVTGVANPEERNRETVCVVAEIVR